MSISFANYNLAINREACEAHLENGRQKPDLLFLQGVNGSDDFKSQGYALHYFEGLENYNGPAIALNPARFTDVRNESLPDAAVVTALDRTTNERVALASMEASSSNRSDYYRSVVDKIDQLASDMIVLSGECEENTELFFRERGYNPIRQESENSLEELPSIFVKRKEKRPHPLARSTHTVPGETSIPSTATPISSHPLSRTAGSAPAPSVPASPETPALDTHETPAPDTQETPAPAQAETTEEPPVETPQRESSGLSAKIKGFFSAISSFISGIVSKIKGFFTSSVDVNSEAT